MSRLHSDLPASDTSVRCLNFGACRSSLPHPIDLLKRVPAFRTVALWMVAPAARASDGFYLTSDGSVVVELPSWFISYWFLLAVFMVGVTLITVFRVVAGRRRRAHDEMRLAVRMGERTRIARELHDSLLQGFQGLLFKLQAARGLLPPSAPQATTLVDEALTIGSQSIQEADRAIQQLRDAAGAGHDLIKAMHHLGIEMTAQHAFRGTLYKVTHEGAPRLLAPLMQDDVYCIAREGVRNAFSHSKARNIRVELVFGAEVFSLRICDDGIGIPPALAGQGKRPGHWGLEGMRERAATFGGSLNVRGGADKGTTVELLASSAVIFKRGESKEDRTLLRRVVGTRVRPFDRAAADR